MDTPKTEDPVPCCGCCCRCSEGWYFGQQWRTINNIIWLIASFLAMITIGLSIMSWPVPDNMDFELLPGDQVLFCPKPVFETEYTHFSSRAIRCNASVTILEDKLKDVEKTTHESHIVIPVTWVSANEYIFRSFYLAPGAKVSWTSTVANTAKGKDDKEDDKPHYALFKSRKAFERYRFTNSYATKKKSEVIGVIPTDKTVTYKTDTMDEYILVLEARSRSAHISANISIDRTYYNSTSQKGVNLKNTTGDGVNIELDGRCALLENPWTHPDDTCPVVVSVRYEVNDVTAAITIVSVLFGLLIAHIISVVVVCCCAYSENRRKTSGKPDFFRDGYSPVPSYDDTD